jgi:uracil-DNA glycosylase
LNPPDPRLERHSARQRVQHHRELLLDFEMCSGRLGTQVEHTLPHLIVTVGARAPTALEQFLDRGWRWIRGKHAHWYQRVALVAPAGDGAAC